MSTCIYAYLLGVRLYIFCAYHLVLFSWNIHSSRYQETEMLVINIRTVESLYSCNSYCDSYIKDWLFFDNLTCFVITCIIWIHINAIGGYLAVLSNKLNVYHTELVDKLIDILQLYSCSILVRRRHQPMQAILFLCVPWAGRQMKKMNFPFLDIVVNQTNKMNIISRYTSRFHHLLGALEPRVPAILTHMAMTHTDHFFTKHLHAHTNNYQSFSGIFIPYVYWVQFPHASVGGGGGGTSQLY